MGAFPVQRQGGDLSTFHNWVAPPLHCHHHHHRNNYHHHHRHRHRHRHRNYYHHLHVIIVTVINNLSPSLPMMLVE